jgi:hypothetical protein
MPYYFTKINNYKGRKKRTYTKWKKKKIRKKDLLNGKQNNPEYSFKQIITAILIIALI